MKKEHQARFEIAVEIGGLFRSLRERYFRKDTIPTPVGLGSGWPLREFAVRALSRICPTSVLVLSNFSATSVLSRRTHGRQASMTS